MAITINGTGTITGISAGGLPDGVITSDDLASGAITAAGLPAGSILQVVRGSTGTGTSISTSGWHDTSLTVNVTPKAANSDFFIVVDQRTYCTSSAQGFGLRIMRNTTALHVPTQDTNGTFDWWFSTNERHLRAHLTFFDTAATYTLGDTLTFKSQGHVYSAATVTFQPTSTVEGSTSYITVMEVAGT